MAGVAIFVSYARKDAATLAARLCDDLTKQGFDVWLDTGAGRIPGGAGWTIKIAEGIDRSEVILALLTPGSYVSENLPR
jgi:hypothetical protein